MLTGRELKQIVAAINQMPHLIVSNNGVTNVFVPANSVGEILKTFVVADDLAALAEEMEKPSGNQEA